MVGNEVLGVMAFHERVYYDFWARGENGFSLNIKRNSSETTASTSITKWHHDTTRFRNLLGASSLHGASEEYHFA